MWFRKQLCIYRPMVAVDLRIRDSLVFDETQKDLAPVEQSELR